MIAEVIPAPSDAEADAAVAPPPDGEAEAFAMPRLFPATGRMLRLLRGAAALTIREAAAETGFTRGRIHELERGIAEPRSRESAALVSAYLLTDGSLRKHLERAHALDAQAADAIARRPRRSRSSQPEPIQMRAGTR